MFIWNNLYSADTDTGSLKNGLTLKSHPSPLYSHPDLVQFEDSEAFKLCLEIHFILFLETTDSMYVVCTIVFFFN